MQFRILPLASVLILVLGACAGAPVERDDTGTAGTAPAGGGEEAVPAPAEPTAVPTPPAEPARPVPPGVMYNVFAGEVAGQHEDYETAARYYLEAARQSQDPAIAERATQVALYAGSHEVAREAVNRLIEIAPDSRRAHRTAVALAVQEGDAEASGRHLERLIGLSESTGQGWQEVSRLLARSGSAEFALEVMGDLVAAADSEPAAWQARSQLASHFERLPPALEYADRALELEPDDASLLAWRGRLRLSDGDYEGAAQDLRAAVERDPDNRQALLNYAEALRRQGDYDRAQELLAGLDQAPELVKTRAALALEDEDWELARELYGRLLDVPAHREEARYFLGQLAELQERFDEALDWYAKVQGEEYRLDARVRRAVVLARQERLDDSLDLLGGLKSGTRAEAEEAFLAEGQILADAGRIDRALEAYGEGLARLPDSQRIQYARALLAAEEGRIELAESDLRALIEANPEDPLALNALGYTLADQTDRLEEARELITRAYELAPEDAAVVDSMGWVEYRLGNHQKALEFLRRALDLQFDAEIAAHLGEVLWVTGERDQARDVWQQALERMPDQSEVVQDTMERLTP